MVSNIRSIEVKNEDLVLILNKMVSMKKENGYMDFVEKGGVYTLNFYDEKTGRSIGKKGLEVQRYIERKLTNQTGYKVLDARNYSFWQI